MPVVMSKTREKVQGIEKDSGKVPVSASSELLSLDTVQVLKAAGDPLRLSVLAVLENASFAVQELASIFDMPQPGMRTTLYRFLSRL